MKNNFIKPMSVAEMTLALDRLTRFKYPEEKFKRVYTETICKNFLKLKVKKSELENYDNKSLRIMFEEVWNFSIIQNFGETSKDFELNKNFFDEERKCFALKKELSELYPKAADFKTLVEKAKVNPNNFKNYKTPRKVVITEGITEKILLPEFSNIHGYSWKENYTDIEAIGGKSRILNQYRIYKEQLKIPVYVLLDFDAKPVFEQIKKELRKTDSIHLINAGEIEDIIPVSIFKAAINTEFKNQIKISVNDFDKNSGNVQNLENIFKEKNLGEFKKAKMAQYIKNILKNTSPLSEELVQILDEIKNL